MAIRNKKYLVCLDQEERESLRSLVRVGKAAACEVASGVDGRVARGAV